MATIGWALVGHPLGDKPTTERPNPRPLYAYHFLDRTGAPVCGIKLIPFLEASGRSGAYYLAHAAKPQGFPPCCALCLLELEAGLAKMLREEPRNA